MIERAAGLSDTDIRTTQRLIDDARRSGLTRFQVLALVRPGDAEDLVLMLDRAEDDVWTVPVAWVHPTETFAHALDWLCEEHLGLLDWAVGFAGTVGYESPDGVETLQLAFDITVPADGTLAWTGPCQWWRTSTEPPVCHPLTRPIVERLRTHADPTHADRAQDDADQGGRGRGDRA